MMMLLSVPTDFSEKFVDAIIESCCSSDETRVHELYGSLTTSLIGSLRPSDTLPYVNLKSLRHHILHLHKAGIEFNYTMNSPWLNALESKSKGRRLLLQHIDLIIDAGVDRITVSLPFLALIIKKYYPHIFVSASIVASIDNMFTLKQWESYGVDRIVIRRELNRNFDLLKIMCQESNVDIEVLATSPCVTGCPNVAYHGLVSSSLSRTDKKKSYMCDVSNYGRFYCHKFVLSNTEEFLKMSWIRPEDLWMYEEVGISHIKIDGRDKCGKYNLERARFYCNRRYDGNFLYLLLDNYPRNLEDFNCKRELTAYQAYIDNRSLDGFVENNWYKNKRCSMICSNCGICHELCKNALQIDLDWKAQMLKEIEEEQRKFLLEEE